MLLSSNESVTGIAERLAGINKINGYYKITNEIMTRNDAVYIEKLIRKMIISEFIVGEPLIISAPYLPNNGYSNKSRYL